MHCVAERRQTVSTTQQICSPDNVFLRRRQFVVILRTNEREFEFQAADEEKCKDWVDLIKKHIYDSQGFKHKLPSPKGKFWKEEEVSEHQFVSLADTFDILLFQSASADGKRIRENLNSEFGK